MKFQLSLCSLLLMPFLCLGQGQVANLLGTWEDSSIIPTSWLDSRYNDIWGDTINGLEIAIMGSTAGTHFIDVTDPTSPTELAFVAGQDDGPGLIHRDFHSYAGHLYAVADEGASTLQVIDMTGLPDAVEVVYDSDELLVQAHNIYIDESQAMLYACNGNGFELRLISLENPAEPELVVSYPTIDFSLPQVHDMYVRNDTAYINGAFDGLWVIDFTEPTNPVLLGTMTDYPQQGYNHSGWLSGDGDTYFLCDETHGMDVKSVDVSDLENIEVTAFMNAASTSNQIAHNAIWHDDLLYVSYYYDGLQVFDVSDPTMPERIAYYDTFEEDNLSSFQGAWGVYPLLPSGNILLSDMNNGLFVFAPVSAPLDYSVDASTDALAVCTNVNDVIEFTITLGEDFNSNGISLTLTGMPVGATANFSSNPAMPGEEVTVTVNAIDGAGIYSLTVNADDGENSTTIEVQLTVNADPSTPLLMQPIDGATNVDVFTAFEWEAVDFEDQYTLEIAAPTGAFDDNILFSLNNTITTFELTTPLDPGAYRWRITATNYCRTSVSETYSFATEGVDAVDGLAIEGLKIFPNPVKSALYVQFNTAQNTSMPIELWNAFGQMVHAQKITANAHIDVNALAAGVYYLKLEEKVYPIVIR